MIKQLPGEYEVVDMRYFLKKFSCPTTESFDELRGAVMAIIDHINNQQPKKPRSTNIALRQRIAEMETALKHIIGISGAGLSAQERIVGLVFPKLNYSLSSPLVSDVIFANASCALA